MNYIRNVIKKSSNFKATSRPGSISHDRVWILGPLWWRGGSHHDVTYQIIMLTLLCEGNFANKCEIPHSDFNIFYTFESVDQSVFLERLVEWEDVFLHVWTYRPRLKLTVPPGGGELDIYFIHKSQKYWRDSQIFKSYLRQIRKC